MHHYIHRTIETDWRKTSRQFPALLLTGPRQVGKTTLLEHLCEKRRKIVSLDDLNLRSLARRDPLLFLQRYSPPVLIDEIQYLQTYLQRDVRDLSQVGDLETFSRFVRACAARTAQMLNYADLARDCGISINTARNWMSILTASFMVYLLPPYHSNITKRLYKTPKLYFLDTGLCAYLTEWTSPKTLEAGAMSGAILETHVIAEILKSWWNRIKFPNLYYYRDKDGREIDLLISKDNRLYPVEIKRSAKINASDISSFAALRRFNRQTSNGAVICLCSEPLPIDLHNSAIPASFI